MKIAVKIHLEKGYIADPYWPERERLITIQKESGLNRVRSLAKRESTLNAYLKAKNLTMEDYQALDVRARRPFYVGADVGLTGIVATEIVIPSHHVHGFLAQAADVAPSAVRLARIEQIRNVIHASDFLTGKTKPDGVWERFVIVKSGTGQTLSNQRALRSHAYIAAVTAQGTLTLVNDEDEPRARQFVAWAGREVGIGASRKLGWGRFEIVAWKVI